MKKYCARCQGLVEAGHKHRVKDRRPSARARGYDDRWAAIRKRFIDTHPICVDCGGQSEVADHWPKSRKQLIAEGVKDPDDPRYLVPRCSSCHNRSTAKEQPGGWNAPDYQRTY